MLTDRNGAGQKDAGAASRAFSLEGGIVRYLLRHHQWPQFKLFVLTVVSTLATLAIIQIWRSIVDDALRERNAALLLELAAVAFAALTIKLASDYCVKLLSRRIENMFIGDMRDKLIAHVLNVANPGSRRSSDANLHDRILNDVGQFGIGIETILIKPIIGSTSMIVYGIYLISIEPLLIPTLLTLLPALLAAPWINLALSEKRRRVVAARERYSAELEQTISAIEDIQSHGTDRIERARLNGFQSQLADSYFREGADLAKINFLSTGAAEIALVAVYLLGGYYTIRGDSSLGTLVAFVAALRYFCAAFTDLLAFSPLYRNVRDRFEEIKSVLRLPLVDAGVGGAAAASVPQAAGYDVGKVSVVVEPNRTTLHEVSIEVPPGQHVAIVGRSGCGKSTLLNVLARHVMPTLGSVRLNGTDLAKMSRPARISAIGYVRQVPFVFGGTVRHNLQYRAKGLADVGVPGAADDKQLIEACRWVGLHKDLLDFALDMVPQTAPAWAAEVVSSRALFTDVVEGRISPENYLDGATVLENLTFRPWSRTDSRLDGRRLRELLKKMAKYDPSLLDRMLDVGRSAAWQQFEIMRSERAGTAAGQGDQITIESDERAAVRHVINESGAKHVRAAFQLALNATGPIDEALRAEIVRARAVFKDTVSFPPVMPHGAGWHTSLSVLENMTGVRVSAGADAQRELLKSRLLSFAEVPAWKERLLTLALDREITEEGMNLSGGQREKMTIARVLVTRPPVLLLDEITAGLDYRSAETVQKALHEHFRATTAIAVMHDLDLARWYDRIIVIADGRVAADIQTGAGVDAAIAQARAALDAV